MPQKVLHEIRENLHAYEAKIVEAIKPFLYQQKRYKVDFSVAIGVTLETMELNHFSEIIRETDQYVALDDNIGAVIFAFNNQQQGVKAASNLLNRFEQQHFGKRIFLGIINSQEEVSPELLVNKLFDTVCYTLLHGMSNIPIDYGEIDN